MSVTTDFVPSDCIFKAFDNIQLKHPDISQKDCLDMSVSWCEKRQSDFYEGKDFDCQEYQDMIHPIAEELIYLECTIDHCNWIVQDVEDFIVQDAVRGAGAESFHRGGKRPGAQKGSPGALTGSAKRQFQKKEPRAKEILKKVPELFEVGSPEQYVKVMGELVPVPELSNGVTTFKGRAGLPNIPMTPVASSVVQGRAVRGMNLYVKFHSSPNEVYKYNMGSNELAQQAFDEMAMGSPGRYVWNNLRGRKLGPVFGKPNQITPGGTTGSIVPYDKTKYTRVKRFMNEVPEFEELAAKMRKFKMAVKAEGEGATSGEPFSQAELKSFQDKMRAEIEDRTKTLEEIREALKKKGAKSMEGIVSQLPDLDFLTEDMDLYNYLTENGKHKIKELYHEGKYRGYQVIDKLGNVLHEKVFSEAELKSSKSKGRGWWGDPERHSTAAKKGKQLLKGDEPKMVKRDFELNDKLVLTLDAKSEKDGRWITVHGGDDDPETAGTHVFIKKGQTAKEAIDEKFKGKSEGKKESKETEKKEPKVEKSEPKTEKKEVSTETYERLIREKQKTEDKHRCVVAKKRIEVMVKKLKNIEKLKELQNLTDKQKNTIDQESKVKKALKSAERAYRKYSELEEGEKKEVSKQTKKMPKGDPKKDDPDKPPKGHYIDEKSGKLKKTEAQKAKEGKEKATAEKKQLSKSEKQAKLKELGDELKKNKRKMNTQAAGTIIELLIKLLQTGSAQDTYAEFKRIRRKNSVMISKDVRLRKSIDKVEKQLKSFDFIRKQDLMDDIYDLELQLIAQGHNIEQIREDFEQWEN